MTPCTCPSCERRRAEKLPGYCCAACDNHRTVLSIDGQERPCSRCDPEGFSAWYKATFDKTRPAIHP